MVIKELGFYENALSKVSDELSKLKVQVPEGVSLVAAKHGGGYQYYLRTRGADDKKSTYIRKDNMEIARKLAQIEYDNLLKIRLQQIITSLHNVRGAIEKNPFEEAANRMKPGKRLLINIPYISDEKYINDWMNQEYEKLGFRDGYPQYYTRKGIRVRSKSEVIIADILHETGIPFLYEKPLRMFNRVVHPDFTLLNIKERKEVYWEHFGMMDDMEYRNKALIKIGEFESMGIYQYDSMICTFESSLYPLNTKTIRKMIIRLRDILGYC